MEMRSFGDLSGPFIPPARGGQASSMIILLHGWGADGNDLADLAYLAYIILPILPILPILRMVCFD